METNESTHIPVDSDTLIHMPHELPPEGFKPSLGAIIRKYRAKQDISKTFLAELKGGYLPHHLALDSLSPL